MGVASSSGPAACGSGTLAAGRAGDEMLDFMFEHVKQLGIEVRVFEERPALHHAEAVTEALERGAGLVERAFLGDAIGFHPELVEPRQIVAQNAGDDEHACPARRRRRSYR